MTWIPELVHGADAERLEPHPPPRWLEPMATALADQPFSHPDWLFESKLAGERALIFSIDRQLWIQTRRQPDAAGSFPEIAEALIHRHYEDFVVDGEVVALDAGRSSADRLRQRRQYDDPRAAGVPVYYYAFDLLYAGGYDLRPLPLRKRKRLLRAMFAYTDPIRYHTYRPVSGEEYFQEACGHGWLGIVAKHGGDAYGYPAARTWLKISCPDGESEPPVTGR